MSKISEYYSDYLSSVANFKKFHNEVINMPRDKFSDAGYEKIRSLANYFLTTKPYYNFEEGLTYKDILGILIENKTKGLLDKINYRNLEFEDEFLRTDITLDELYKDKNKGGLGFGRLFRHKSCQEIAYSNDKLLVSILRNNWLSDNINTNGYVPYLRGINISSDADYRPTYSILKYIKNINRPATLFEISVLFGRIDKVQKEKDIFKRAIEISEELPLSQDEQIQYFFNKMGWRGYSYNRSQEPYFKFRSFLEYMENLELILINNDSSTITLSEYSENLLKDEETRRNQVKLMQIFCQAMEDEGFATGVYINGKYLDKIDEIKGIYSIWGHGENIGGYLYHKYTDFDHMYYGYKTVDEYFTTTYNINVIQTTSYGIGEDLGIDGRVDFDYADKEFFDALYRLFEEKQAKKQENKGAALTLSGPKYI